MSVCFSALMCHAPIVIPDIAGERAYLCSNTTRTMREIAQRLVASGADRLVLISPHSPRHKRSFCAWQGPHRGSLAKFGHPQICLQLPDAPEVARLLRLPLIQDRSERGNLDHGAMVPLFFLREAGWSGATAILSIPWSSKEHSLVGRALRKLPGRTAVIASGDMSHRLEIGAPAGFHPRAKEFDAAFVAALRFQRWSALGQLPYQADAAEDVVDSTLVAVAAAGFPNNPEVLSYEGPWGVGYTQAIFYDENPPFYALARRAVESKIRRTVMTIPNGPSSKGVFVTLTKDNRLRGCIGHIFPVKDNLYQEVAEVARKAASVDTRFTPVELEELTDIRYEVSMLQEPEKVSSLHALDPIEFGIIVRSGRKVGVLLPNLAGVSTVHEQLKITMQKASIESTDNLQIERFRVRKCRQPQ